MAKPHKLVRVEKAVKSFTDFIHKEAPALSGTVVTSFNRKKSAYTLSQTRLRDTGSIDTRRLAQYRTSDNIFTSSRLTPKGKNHALIINIDLSGSIVDILDGILRQAYLLYDFARRVSIPVTIVGFTSSSFYVDNKKHYNNIIVITDETYSHEEVIDALTKIVISSVVNRIANDIEYLKHSPDLEYVAAYELLKPFCNLIHFGATPTGVTSYWSLQKAREFREKGYQLVNIITITDGDPNRSDIVDADFASFLDIKTNSIISSGNYNNRHHDFLTKVNDVIKNEGFNNIVFKIVAQGERVHSSRAFFDCSLEKLDEISHDLRKNSFVIVKDIKNCSYSHCVVLKDSIYTDKKLVEYEFNTDRRVSTKQLSSQLIKKKSSRERSKVLLDYVGGVIAESFKVSKVKAA